MRNSKVRTGQSEVNPSREVQKSGFENTAKAVHAVAEYSQRNIKAYFESAAIAGEAFKTIGREISFYSKKSGEEAIAVTKAIMNSKSITEALELQTNFTRMTFGAYVGQVKILHGLFLDATEETLAPVHSRFEALSDSRQSPTTA
jgi:hypothetical protein